VVVVWPTVDIKSIYSENSLRAYVDGVIGTLSLDEFSKFPVCRVYEISVSAGAATLYTVL